MGNVVSRYIGCVDTEVVEYTWRGGDSTDDTIKLVDHVEFIELDFEEAQRISLSLLKIKK